MRIYFCLRGILPSHYRPDRKKASVWKWEANPYVNIAFFLEGYLSPENNWVPYVLKRLA